MHLRVEGLPARLLGLAPLLAVLLPMGPAQAHTGLVDSAPSDGERLGTSPSRVVLEFGAPVSATGASVLVLDGRGDQRAEDVLVSHDGTAASIVLAPDGAAGHWQVRYEVRGEDGHLVAGALAFGVDAPAAPRGAALPALPATAAAGAVLVTAVLVLRGWLRRDPNTVR